jgi:hypothetical protein
MAKRNVAKLAFRFVLIIGIVNFFADMTYEGSRSVVGPFLGSLGASAAIVGFVAGFGELVGYGLRSVSGYFADKTHRYWAVAFVGYAINMLAVPALALAGNWPLAAALIVAERTGRAIRRPAVEAMPLPCKQVHRAGLGIRLERGFGPDRRNTWASNHRFCFIPARELSSHFCCPADLSIVVFGRACRWLVP